MNVSLIEKINPSKEYTLNEILESELIPNIRSSSALYNLVTNRVPSDKNKLGKTRVLCTTTGKGKLKASHSGTSWNKISGKIKVLGKDLIIFLKVNNYLNDN